MLFFRKYLSPRKNRLLTKPYAPEPQTVLSNIIFFIFYILLFLDNNGQNWYINLRLYIF